MILLRKALRQCKVLLKITFIRAKTIKEERIGNPELGSDAQASDEAAAHHADLVRGKADHFGHSRSYRIFL